MNNLLRLGAQADSALVYHNQPKRAIKRIKKVGRDTRIIVPYQKVQEIGWNPYQRAVHDARKAGLHVQVALSAPKLNRHDYAQFAAQAATRLHGVRTWSPLNEPELAGYTPQEYRSTYQLGQRVIGKRTHHSKYLIGETSPYDPIDYLRAVLNAGHGRLTASGYAHHPYQFTAPPEQAYGPRSYIGIGKLNVLQRELKRDAKRGLLTTPHGKKLPLYLTEFGYQRQGSRAVSARTRKRWIKQAVKQARRSGAKQLLFYGAVPTPDEPWNTGLSPADLRAADSARRKL